MTRTGRPRTLLDSIKINVRIESDIKQALQSFADRKELTISQVIRQALIEFIRNHAFYFNDQKGILRRLKI